MGRQRADFSGDCRSRKIRWEIKDLIGSRVSLLKTWGNQNYPFVGDVITVLSDYVYVTAICPSNRNSLAAQILGLLHMGQQ